MLRRTCHHRLCTGIVTLGLIAFATPAFAQFYADEDNPELISSTTTTTTGVLVGVIFLTVVAVTQDSAALQRYLDANEPAVRQAMATGGGDALEDVAAFFGIRESQDLPAFGQVLRAQRKQLARLAWRDRDIGAFQAHLRSALAFDPRFRTELASR